ncbi:hypothetical protein FB107DRAFT_252267 [Schizophyllum commune]
MDATPSDLLDTKIPAERQRKRRKIKDIIYPYPNVSSFLFNHHHHIGGATKTLGERDRAYQLMNDPRFHSEDVCGVNFKKMDELVAADVQSPWEGNGWTTTPVTIKIPTGQKMTAAKRKERARERAAAKRHETVKPAGSDDNCYQYHAANVHTQSLMHILKSAVVEEELSKEFHWHPSPYEEQWTPPYEDFNVESIAQFGPSKAWPLYVFFGNLSMHKRMKPSTHAAHQAAFFPSLPDSINDFLRSKGITPTAPLLTHCRRELFHEVWKVLLSDEEFRYAYEHGVVLMCADGIKRRIYARLFTHSADYPEKVLIATIRDLGACLCTRCTVPKSEIRALGTNKDHDVRVERKRTDDWSRREKVTEARHIITMTDTLSIARQSRNFSSANHLFLLSPQNAFSAFASQLTRFHFDVFEMLVTDFMHEFELGVWKSPLTHLIRMLYSPDRAEVLLLNARFRMTPNFGYDTIRYFRSNVAELKQLAAHDYEDTLQCSIPCLEDVICPTYATRETDHEFNSRKRMEAKKASTTPASPNMASPAHNGVLKRRRLRMGASNLDAQFAKYDIGRAGDPTERDGVEVSRILKEAMDNAQELGMLTDEFSAKLDEEFERVRALRDEKLRHSKYRLAVRQECAQRLLAAKPPKFRCRGNLAYIMSPLIKMVLKAAGLMAGSFIDAAPPAPGSLQHGYTILSVHEGETIDSEGRQRSHGRSERRITILTEITAVTLKNYAFTQKCNIWRNKLLLESLTIGASIENLFAQPPAQAAKRKRRDTQWSGTDAAPSQRRNTRAGGASESTTQQLRLEQALGAHVDRRQGLEANAATVDPDPDHVDDGDEQRMETQASILSIARNNNAIAATRNAWYPVSRRRREHAATDGSDACSTHPLHAAPSHDPRRGETMLIVSSPHSTPLDDRPGAVSMPS